MPLIRASQATKQAFGYSPSHVGSYRGCQGSGERRVRVVERKRSAFKRDDGRHGMHAPSGSAVQGQYSGRLVKDTAADQVSRRVWQPRGTEYSVGGIIDNNNKHDNGRAEEMHVSMKSTKHKVTIHGPAQVAHKFLDHAGPVREMSAKAHLSPHRACTYVFTRRYPK